LKTASGETAVLDVDVQEVALRAKPGETATGTFKLSNTGVADLSFSISASGSANSAPMFSAVPKEGLLGATNSSFSNLPPRVSKEAIGERPRTSLARAVQARNMNVTSPAILGDDMLIIDDGNDSQDSFIGLQGNFDTYWANRFVAPESGFLLEKLSVFLRTESAADTSFFVAIDTEDARLAEVTLPLASSPDGGWYEISPPAPLSLAGGQVFYIILGAPKTIKFPAGADMNASMPNNSFYFEPSQNSYVPLGSIRGFENGAFLIRAVGTKLGGANQPPIAKAQVSASTAGVNEPITFDASQSSDPDGQITQYLWDFGDGSSSDQKIATHAYAQAGNYLAKLTVTDDKGAQGEAIRFVTISGGTSRLTVNPISGTVAAGGSQTINVTFDTQGLAEGNYQGRIDITSNGGNRTIPVSVRVSNDVVNVAELSYDNGEPTTAYFWPEAGQGSAVRFTPPSKPAKVSQAKIFITDLTNGNQFNLRVLADMNGAPGSTIYGPAPVTVAETGWVTFDLSGANIIANGDFYVMIEYDGTSTPNFGSETTPPISKRSWDFGGQSWTLFDTEDYLIRAVVEFTTGVATRNGEASLPARFELAQNYPNPFNPETMIKYQLPNGAHIELVVYDLTGRRVAALESGLKPAGVHAVRWNGRDRAGNRVPTGIYFYRLEARTSNGTVTTLTRKLTVLK
jgi:PKD repeat protein